MAEWFKAAVLKTVVRETVPGVRIPLPPPAFARRSRCSRLRLASRVCAWSREGQFFVHPPSLSFGQASPSGLAVRFQSIHGKTRN